MSTKRARASHACHPDQATGRGAFHRMGRRFRGRVSIVEPRLPSLGVEELRSVRVFLDPRQ